MVRFLRSRCLDFETRPELDRFLRVERLIAALHIPASLCLAVGTLAEANVFPYLIHYMWHLLFVSSLFLVIANGRDANACVRDFFISHTIKGAPANNQFTRKVHRSVEGQMHMFAAVVMTLGSLSLFNASVIALFHNTAAHEEICRRQYALGFGLHLIGAAGNNIATDKAMHQVNATRVLLSFQNVMASAAYGISGILLLPSMQFAHDNAVHHLALTMSTTIGGTIAVLSAVMQYFHTLAFTHAQLDHFRRTQTMMRLNRDMSTSIPCPKRGYVSRLTNAIRTRGKSLWCSQIPSEEEDDDDAQGAASNISTDDDFLVLSNDAGTPLEWTHSSSSDSVREDSWPEGRGKTGNQLRTRE